jgi:hypothetical protein
MGHLILVSYRSAPPVFMSHRPQTKHQQRQVWEQYAFAAIIAMTAAEEEDDEELEQQAQLLAVIAMQRLYEAQSIKYGPRGPYNGERFEDLIDAMLDEVSERRFRAYFRSEYIT